MHRSARVGRHRHAYDVCARILRAFVHCTAGLFAQWEGNFGILGSRGGLLPTAVIRSGLGGGLLTEDKNSAEASQSLAEMDFCEFLSGAGTDSTLYTGLPSSSSLWHEMCKRAGVELVSGVTIGPPTRQQDGWIIEYERDGHSGERTQEPVAALVLATQGSAQLPANVLHELCTSHMSVDLQPFRNALDNLQSRLRGLQTKPVYSLMVVFANALDAVPFDAAVPHGCTRLRWIARDSSKPGRAREDGLECWVAHSTEVAATGYHQRCGGPESADRQQLDTVAAEMYEALSHWLRVSIATSCGQDDPSSVVLPAPVYGTRHLYSTSPSNSKCKLACSACTSMEQRLCNGTTWPEGGTACCSLSILGQCLHTSNTTARARAACPVI
eukprot:COSAG05_NODE_2580_length_2877_cov_2.473002_3_plen_384_part_00